MTTRLSKSKSSKKDGTSIKSRSSSVNSSRRIVDDSELSGDIKKTIFGLTREQQNIDSALILHLKKLAILQNAKTSSYTAAINSSISSLNGAKSDSRSVLDSSLANQETYIEFQNEMSTLRMGIVEEFGAHLSNLKIMLDLICGNFGQNKNDTDDDVLFTYLEGLLKKLNKTRAQLKSEPRSSPSRDDTLQNLHNEIMRIKAENESSSPQLTATNLSNLQKRYDQSGMQSTSDYSPREMGNSQVLETTRDCNGSRLIEEESNESSDDLPIAQSMLANLSFKKKNTSLSNTLRSDNSKQSVKSPSQLIERMSNPREQSVYSSASNYSVPRDQIINIRNTMTAGEHNSVNQSSASTTIPYNSEPERIGVVALGDRSTDSGHRARSFSKSKLIRNVINSQEAGVATNNQSRTSMNESNGSIYRLKAQDTQSVASYNVNESVNSYATNNRIIPDTQSDCSVYAKARSPKAPFVLSPGSVNQSNMSGYNDLDERSSIAPSAIFSSAVNQPNQYNGRRYNDLDERSSVAPSVLSAGTANQQSQYNGRGYGSYDERRMSRTASANSMNTKNKLNLNNSYGSVMYEENKSATRASSVKSSKSINYSVASSNQMKKSNTSNQVILDKTLNDESYYSTDSEAENTGRGFGSCVAPCAIKTSKKSLNANK